MGCIYYHKNKINGHMYIGQSVFEPHSIISNRWGTVGQGYESCSYFWNAINKYGWENFEHGFFERNVPNDLLDEKEKFYILKYHTYTQDPEYKGGYNLTPGGDGSLNTWRANEDAWLNSHYSIEKTREQLVKEYRDAFPDSYHSDGAIMARLKTLRLSNIENVNFWTEEEDQLLAETWPVLPFKEILEKFPDRNFYALESRASKLKIKRKVNCMPNYSQEENDILFKYYPDFGVEFCREMILDQCGIERTHESVKTHAKILRLKIKGREKFTANAGFNLEEFEKIYYNFGTLACMEKFNLTKTQVYNITRINSFHRDRKTIKTGLIAKKVYCVETNQIFNSAKEAGTLLEMSPGAWHNILFCCQNKRKTAGGYHWQYA